jgi:hypothetical protein
VASTFAAAALLGAFLAAGLAAPFVFGAVFLVVPRAMAWARFRPSAWTCLIVVSSVISKSSLSDRARMPIEAIAEPDVYLIASSK